MALIDGFRIGSFVMGATVAVGAAAYLRRVGRAVAVRGARRRIAFERACRETESVTHALEEPRAARAAHVAAPEESLVGAMRRTLTLRRRVNAAELGATCEANGAFGVASPETVLAVIPREAGSEARVSMRRTPLASMLAYLLPIALAVPYPTNVWWTLGATTLVAGVAWLSDLYTARVIRKRIAVLTALAEPELPRTRITDGALDDEHDGARAGEQAISVRRSSTHPQG